MTSDSLDPPTVVSPEPDDVKSFPIVPGEISVSRPTALSNKLNSVLATSYADSDIRGALETLDSRGIQNTAESRRQLRLEVQKEVIDCNGKIVTNFGKVAEQLKRIGTVISSLNTICEEMRKHLTLARQETASVLEEASVLMLQKQETEARQRLLDAFNKRFIMSGDDLHVLTSPLEPVDDHFFEVLARMKQIHSDCEVLLGAENQRLGLEIMEQSSKSLNAAFQKLYKWIQKEFRSLNLEDPQISSSIRRALRVLAERPSLFNSCLGFFAEAREHILSEAFHYALTDTVSGEANERMSQPIEFSAHDPLRYIGDMLAWVHSAAVSEREALEALFVSDRELAKGIQIGINSEPWARLDGGEVAFDGLRALNDLVTQDLNGVSLSLRQRVELVVQGHDGPVTLYKVTNLLAFYQTTFSKLVGPESALVATITALENQTFMHFESLMQEQITTLSADPAALVIPNDLGVPEFLADALETLTSLMKVYDASFRAEPSSDSACNENKFTQVIRVALDPFVELAKTTSNTLSHSTDRTIFQINSLLLVRSTIAPYHFACATHLAPLSTALTTLSTELLEIQHDFLLRASGLQQLLVALKPFTSTADLSSNHPRKAQPSDLARIASLPEFQPSALSLASQLLDDFLPSALVDATEHFKLIHSSGLVKSVTEEAVEEFCHDFEFVESMILGADEAIGKAGMAGEVNVDTDDEEDTVENKEVGHAEEDVRRTERWSLRALFPRTTGEIRVLLS